MPALKHTLAALLAAALSLPALADGYAAVWRPGSGTQWVRGGISADEFKTQDLAYFKQGLRLTALTVRDGHFTAVWRPGSGTQWVHWDMDGDEFKAKDTAYFKQGLRIAAFSLHKGRIAAVWRPGSGTQWVHWGKTGDEFKALDTGYFKQGLRITQIEVDGGHLAAVWRPGTGTQWVHWGLSSGGFADQDKTYFAQGLRIASLAVEDGHYAGVWRPGSGTQYWSARRCGVDFKTEDQSYFSQGLRLAVLKRQDDAHGAYHYPWKNGDSYGVAQGNNNPGGSHNGSQAYAFDFSLPSGTEVRAARDGTVEWFQQSQTSNYDPSSPTTPSNTPYPGGDLRNWGNALRVKHLGGFTSWYFHLTPNSVKVNVGDKVQAGTVLALSDNTGRSTGPHLHFQVQADSKNWGQSVPISFNSCDVPTGGDTAKSDNGNPN